ncbi:fibronectin type III domain-containing protein [Bacteriovorax sp. PP10]|uniref:Fibronectin type III domain-containing protein n=1 Tax=Bacteriovorax antarcticus TaxID=3088717 RepID=A0ABU5W089_9BACT|nr:fibronectin type III domain-containing protein [Bacteriovorax sp. PP10]MEA9357240.1 fibronectin type III domain-containing protein [Bacteriovorax sp. PP10]
MLSYFRSSLFTFCLIIGLSGCNEIKVNPKALQREIGTVGSSDIVFAGLTSIDQVTDTTMRLNWTNNADASAYQIYRMVAGTPSYITTIPAPASTLTLTGFTPNTSYTFRVRALDSTGATDVNTTTQTITTNLAPNVPSGIALQTPSASPSLVSTPTIRVSGVKSGDVVKLFTNSLCTAQVASGTAAGTTIDLTTSTLAVAAYTFYANSTNTYTHTSACSSATVAYVISSCPANFLGVPFNTNVGTTTDFCVAKYEMRCVGASCPTSTPGVNAVATSQSSGTPWTNINHPDSITACSNLNAINGVSNKFYLISNPEWMTIARNIESVDSNWSGGTAGSGVLPIGWTALNSGPAPSTDASCLYNTGSDTCAATGAFKYRRTHTLSNGEVIWDLAGSVWEWIDWIVTPANKAYVAARPINTAQGFEEFRDLDVNVGATDEMKPSTWQPTFLNLTGADGIGRYDPGINSTGGYAVRGGAFWYGDSSGIYTLDVNSEPNASYGILGFRCVYRL